MSAKPDDIPQDIWDVALRLATDCAFEGHVVRVEHVVTDIWAMSDEDSAKDIARAILAERQKWQAVLASIDAPPLDMWEAMESANTPMGESGTARKAPGGKRTEQSEMRSLQQGPSAAPPNNSPAADPAPGANNAPGAASNDDFRRVPVIGEIE